MGERRMLSKKITNSAKFMKMPIDTQCLYMHLAINADDDGIVEAFTIMRMFGFTDDNLKLLVAKGFAVILNDDLVTYLTDWLEHNSIRADRKLDSKYQGLLLQVLPDVQLVQPKERADRKKGPPQLPEPESDTSSNSNDEEAGASQGQPTDCVSKDKLSEDNKKESPMTKHKYGEYKNVSLSNQEFEKLKSEFPTDYKERIEQLSGYMASKGKSYKNHLATIENWERRKNEADRKSDKPQTATQTSGDTNYDYQKFFG